MDFVFYNWHVQFSSTNCGIEIKLLSMSGITDAVFALFDNGKFKFISFVAVEFIVVVLAHLTFIGLCSIVLSGHVSVMKWLVAAESRCPSVSSLVNGFGSSGFVSRFFCILLYCSLHVTTAARFL